jgi:hypothetical protein
MLFAIQHTLHLHPPTYIREDEEHGGGKDEKDLLEDEGMGSLPFEPDPSLAWEPPKKEEYVAPDERLQPRERKMYQRG